MKVLRGLPFVLWFAPLLLLARQLVLWLLAGVGLGAAGAVAVRRLLK